MVSTKISCPFCGETIELCKEWPGDGFVRVVPTGTAVECPKCKKVFSLTDLGDDSTAGIFRYVLLFALVMSAFVLIMLW